MTPPISELLRLAANGVMWPGQWARGSLHRRDGSRCAVGWFDYYAESGPEARERLRWCLGTPEGEPLWQPDLVGEIMSFNDGLLIHSYPEATAEDVCVLLLLLAEAAEDQEAREAVSAQLRALTPLPLLPETVPA